MAKISSYPSDANVTTSDRLIGSDNENSNETKNFGVGDIINLAASIIVPPGGFVPYTGATGNVDLGTYGLTTSYLTSNYGMFIDGAISLNGDEGNTGEVLVSQGPGVAPSWASLSGTYVPYTGATGNVDLGNNSLDADVINAGDVYANNLFNSGGNPSVFVGNDSNSPVGLLINTSTNIFKLGDYNGNFNATHIAIEDGSSRITFVGGFNLSNGQGTSGQVLTSAGAGATPVWTTLPSTSSFVPYTGATTAVNLGIYSMTAANIAANNFVPILGGSGNTFFGGAGGYGVAYNGMYCIGTNTTILGNSTPGSSTNIEINNSIGLISFNYGDVSLDNIDSLLLSNGQGTSGESVLVSGGGGSPSWKYPQDIVAFPFLSAYSDINQVVNAINVGQAMILNQIVQSSSISIDPDVSSNLTRIAFNDSGMYNIQFSAQIRRTTGGGASEIDIWFRKGGIDIPNSNTSLNVQNSAGYLVASWNFFYYIDILQPNPFIEIMWATTDTSVQLAYASSNAVHPATPSVIVTVNKVSNVI